MISTLKKITVAVFSVVVAIALLLLLSYSPVSMNNGFEKPAFTNGASSYTVFVDGEVYNQGDVLEFGYTGEICQFSYYDDSGNTKMLTVLGADPIEVYHDGNFTDASSTIRYAYFTIQPTGSATTETIEISYKIIPKKVTVQLSNVIKKGNNYYLETKQGTAGEQVSSTTFSGAVKISPSDVSLQDLGYKVIVSGENLILKEIDASPNYEIINLSTAKAQVKQSFELMGWIPSIAFGALALVFLIVFFGLMGSINKLKKS